MMGITIGTLAHNITHTKLNTAQSLRVHPTTIRRYTFKYLMC